MTAIENKKRILGLDLVRCIAVFFVISVHYLLHSCFYRTEMYGISMYILTIMRWLFYTCVPLFLLLTGYLKCNKKVDKEHYKSIIPILSSYLFLSIVTIFALKFYFHREESVLHFIKGIFNYSTIGYAWYVEMYIGLFLLIPFLNILYQNIKTKRQKQILILTLFFLTAIPSVFAGISIYGKTLDVFPDWWTQIYPLLYYFIGCYIREYKIRMPKIKNILYLSLVLVLEATISYFASGGNVFGNILEGYFAFPTVIASTLLFLLFYDVNIKNKIIRIFVTDISKLSFEIYLFSVVTDVTIYAIFGVGTFSSKKLLLFYPFFSILVLLVTYICVFVKRCITEGAIKLMKTEV